MADAAAWYDAHATRLVPTYESLAPAGTREWLAASLPRPPAVVMDIGAGTGRDAAALAADGYDVVAVEPSAGMRAEGARLHASPRLRWMADSLPALGSVSRAGLTADVVLANAVWQHVAHADRARAFRKMATLLAPGGILAITLRHGPDDGRGAHPVDGDEIERLARDHGLQVVRRLDAADALGRAEIRWTNMVLRLPDDGTGALPLLRHVILLQEKSSTYKLGLLRAVCRAADAAAGLAVRDGDGHVVVPLGLVALNWLRLYLPLTAANLPQAPRNRMGADGLGFAGPGWTALAGGAATVRDLRVGAAFGPSNGPAVWAALREAADLIVRMPATHLTAKDGTPVLPTRRARAGERQSFVLDSATLSAFGSMRISADLWRAMGRFAAWIEPALVAEWTRLMLGYAATQGRQLDQAALATATSWSDPDRGVGLPRSIATGMLAAGRSVLCTWSGRRLEARNLDLDHCLPWAAWPWGDLWNVVPADSRINRHSKRGLLPSAAALGAASERLAHWWMAAYLDDQGQGLSPWFAAEARASLPGLAASDSLTPEELLSAVALQRLRLRHDQGVPEWGGADR